MERSIKKKSNKLLCICLAIMMGISIISGVGQNGNINKLPQYVNAESNSHGVSNPRVAYNTRECIYFGNYLQEVDGTRHYETEPDGDGYSTHLEYDSKVQPIKWQILSRNGNDVFLLSDKVLDWQPYNESGMMCTWEDSSLRAWLNDTFINTAFSENEQKAIMMTDVDNYNEKNTNDRVYLLSKDEVKNASYGFQTTTGFDQARAVSYLYQDGKIEYGGSYFLRNPDTYISFMFDSINIGSVTDYYGGLDSRMGIRPVLHLDLSKAKGLYKTAEAVKVSIKGTIYDTVVFGKYNNSPLTWRVLHVNGDDAFLLADKILDYRAYNDQKVRSGNYADRYYYACSWKNASLRSWMNNEFYKKAFSSDEAKMIKLVKRKDDITDQSLEFVEDKVYLLTPADIVNPSFGFPGMDLTVSDSRKADSLDGVTPPNNWSNEWIVGPPVSEDDSSGVRGVINRTGEVYEDRTVQDILGVRPALHIDLTSTSWKKGTTISFGDVTGATVQEGPDEQVVVPESEKKPDENKSNEKNTSDETTESKTTTRKDNQKGVDGTAFGKGASLSLAEKTLTSMKNDSDPKGSVYNILQLKVKKATKNNVTLSFSNAKKSGAVKYILYGNKCGKKNKYKKLLTTTKTNIKVSKIGKTKLKKGTYYKFILIAIDKNNMVVSISKTVHVATTGGKIGNYKKVNTAARKNKITLKTKDKKKKKFKLKAKAVNASKKLKVKKHRGIKYECSNKKIAAVSSKGVITAKKKGTCYVYVYAQSGTAAKIKVTVR